MYSYSDSDSQNECESQKEVRKRRKKREGKRAGRRRRGSKRMKCQGLRFSVPLLLRWRGMADGEIDSILLY